MYDSTLLVQDNSIEEIRKADLDLLKKINEISTSASSTTAVTTSTTTQAQTVESSSTASAKLIAKAMYTGNGVQLADGTVITFGQKTGGSVCALFNGAPTGESTYSAPFRLQKPVGETGTLTKIDMWTYGGCALYSTGNFYVSGYNANGVLGLGNTTSQSMLTLTSSNVIDYRIPQSLSYTIAQTRMWIKKTDGLWYVAGYNLYGACGVGNTTDQLSWIHPSSMSSDVKELWNFGASFGCTLYLTNSNRLFAAGYNAQGQFGNASTTNATSFTDITNYWNIQPNDEIKITGEFGYYSTQAFAQGTLFILKKSSNQQGYSVYASGNNQYGALADGTVTASTSPKIIKNLPENVDVLKTSGGTPLSVYALTLDKKLYVWGYNANGQLGLGNVVNQTSVQLASISGEQIDSIFADAHADNYSFANQAFIKTKSGKIYVAGDSGNGQTGDGTFVDKTTWTQIPFDTDNFGNIVDISWNGYGDGGFYITAVTDKNRFFATGYNSRQGISLTGEAISKSVFTELVF